MLGSYQHGIGQEVAAVGHGRMAGNRRARPGMRLAVLAGACSLAMAACSSGAKSGSASPATASRAAQGGVVTLAESAQGQPNYIFPLVTAATLTVANTGYLQGLLYRPLYFFGGDGHGVGLNEKKSLAYPPVYSGGGKTVTVKLKHYRWSDGQP